MVKKKKKQTKYQINEKDIYYLAQYFKEKLKIKQKITLIFDVQLYFRTRDYDTWTPIKKYIKKDWGDSETDTRILRINLIRHVNAKNTWELYNTIIHELLHHKHNDWSEAKVIKETERLLLKWNIYKI